MELLSIFTPLFTAGIFFIGFLALLLAGFSAMLEAKVDPIKKDIARLEAGQAKLERGLAKLESKIDQVLAKK